MKHINIKHNLLFSIVFFGFSIVQAQEVITSEKAVKLALENNYGIKVANNNIQIAENNSNLLNTDYLPTLTGNAGAVYNLDNIDAEFSNGTSTELNGATSSGYNASLNLNYTLFDGFGRKYDYQNLQEQYQLSELQARETIENTVIQLFSIYYNVARVKENSLSLNEVLAVSKDRLSRANYQFEYGQNSKLNILNAQVDINNDSINLINSNQQLTSAKRDLNVVLGNTLSSEFEVDTSITFVLNEEKASLLEKTKSRNIALLLAEKNIILNELNIKSNQSTYLPTVGLTGSYGWNRNNNNEASFLSVASNNGLSGGLSLTWNLFNGRNITNVNNAKINLETERLQKESTLISLERDFNNAWDDYQNKLNIYLLQKDNIITSQNNFDRTKEQFDIGQVNSTEFRQAQLNLLNAKLSTNAAKYEAKFAELQLLQLSGELLNVPF